MGIIRGGGLIIIAIILFICLLIGNVFLVISSSLEYESVEKNLGSVMQEVVSSQVEETENVDEGFDKLKEYCETHQDFVLDSSEYDFSISCEEVLAGNSEDIVNKEAEKFLAEIYYKDYDCSFIDCFGQEDIPFFLVSEHTQKYVRNLFYYSLVAWLVLIGVMFFLVQNKKNLLIIVGVLVAVSALPFMRMSSFSFISSNEYVPMIFSLFISAQSVFLTMFIVGLVLLGLGIGLKFWKGGRKKRK